MPSVGVSAACQRARRGDPGKRIVRLPDYRLVAVATIPDTSSAATLLTYYHGRFFMPPIQTRLLEQIAVERERVQTRRAVLGTGARVAAAGALGTAFAGAGVISPASIALAQEFENDIEILNYALTLEHLEYAFYRDGLAELGKAQFDESAGEGMFELLSEIEGHEQAHVDALTQTIRDLEGEPVAEGTYDFGYDDVASFLEVATALENTGVAAYAGAAPSIEDDAILSAALGIHSVEARHAAFLNGLNSSSPFPEAVDAPLTMEEVLEIAGEFIVSEESSATPASGSTEAGEAVVVDIKAFKFLPETLEIPAGTEVTWNNGDLVLHTVVAEDESFESENIARGDTYSFTFETAGRFPYICGIHTSMKGEVVVS